MEMGIEVMGKWELECSVGMEMGGNGNRGYGKMGIGMQCWNVNGWEWE